jgi:hypothetical protein
VKLPKYMEMLCSTLYDGKFSIQKNRWNYEINRK